MTELQSCGHPLDAVISSDEGTSYCGECARLASVSPEPRDDATTEREEEPVVDPGGRLQDITDPALRSAVARMRGARGGARTASAAASTPKHEPQDAGDAADGSAEPAPLPQSHEQLRRSALVAILNDSDALDTSKVAAARELRAMEDADRNTAGHSTEAQVWLAVRDTLDLIPPEHRAQVLREKMGDAAPSVSWEDEDGWADEGEPIDTDPPVPPRAVAPESRVSLEPPEQNAQPPEVS